MSNPASIEPLPPEVRRQAAEWVVELQSEGVTAETRQRWQQWRGSHPDHEHAWQRIESFGIKLRGLPSAFAHAALAAPGSAQRRQLIKALAVLLFVGGTTSWVVQEKALLRHWVADRRTGTGARADFTLPDGTRIQLNTRTAVDIRFSASERVLRLLDGEILITTGHDRVAEPAATYRPLIIQTAQGRIRALGTRFSVREVEEDAGDTSRVAVYEGAVEIRPKDAVGPLVLRAGEQGRFTRTAAEFVGPADRDSTAWTQGMIIAQDMPLANFLAELDRHRPGRLACDPAIAQLRVSGTYPLADTDRVLDMLVTVLPVQVRFITRYWVTVQSSR